MTINCEMVEQMVVAYFNVIYHHSLDGGRMIFLISF
jgi:hypothetical protein